MSRFVSLMNYVVVAVVAGTFLSFATSPSAPRPLPDDSKFTAQIMASDVVVVKFGADWCPPCRMMEEQLNQLTVAEPEVSVVRLNIEQHPELASHYGVSSIPHVVLFKHGKDVDHVVGYRDYKQLQAWIKASR